jgi:hypothetical protein
MVCRSRSSHVLDRSTGEAASLYVMFHNGMGVWQGLFFPTRLSNASSGEEPAVGPSEAFLGSLGGQGVEVFVVFYL